MEDDLLFLAERSYHEKQYDAACAVLLHLLRSSVVDYTQRGSTIAQLLTAALRDWGSEPDQLDASGFQLLMKAYHESLQLMPLSSAPLNNNLGGLLFR